MDYGLTYRHWERTFTTKSGHLVTVKLDLSEAGKMDQILGVIGNVSTSASNYQRWIRGLKTKNVATIKGIYGEALAQPHVKYAYSIPNNVNPKVADILEDGYYDINGNWISPKKQGIDQDYPAATARGKVFAEVKIRKYGSGDQGNVLDEFERQFHKHLMTKILKEIDTTTGQFFGGKVPILHYEIGGSFFTEGFQKKMLERFKEILERDEFIELREAGFVFEERHIHNMLTDSIMN